MFFCDHAFQRYDSAIRRVWNTTINFDTVGNWNSVGWWGAIVGFLFISPGFVLLTIAEKGRTFHSLAQVYCTQVNDCFHLAGKTFLPGWYVWLIALWVVLVVASFAFQWGYQKRHWCFGWWSNLVAIFALSYLFPAIGMGIMFIGSGNMPHLEALVGYGLPIVHAVWFLGSLLPSMRPLWRGERIAFRPPPLKLRAGAGSAAALLGILGVALGRMFGEMSHGNWGYLVVGTILTPWLMYLLIRGGVQSLVTLAPWRIVLEAEAGEEAEGEGQ